MSAEVFVDASSFMGMHGSDDTTRIACKALFVERLADGIVMSLEQVGRCDDLVWRRARAVQDAYYPFMDHLHTEMPIERRGYEEADLRTALESARLAGLPMHERLLLALVMNRSGTLFTISPRVRDRSDLPVRVPTTAFEPSFPERLEGLYRRSLRLRVATEAL